MAHDTHDTHALMSQTLGCIVGGGALKVALAAAVVRTGRFCAQAAIGDDLHAVALQQTCAQILKQIEMLFQK
jgi:hypothetical protein